MSVPYYVEQSLRDVEQLKRKVDSLREDIARGEDAATKLPDALVRLEEAKQKHIAHLGQMIGDTAPEPSQDTESTETVEAEVGVSSYGGDAEYSAEPVQPMADLSGDELLDDRPGVPLRRAGFPGGNSAPNGEDSTDAASGLLAGAAIGAALGSTD